MGIYLFPLIPLSSQERGKYFWKGFHPFQIISPSLGREGVRG
jgi:hypothetical protein